MVTNTAYALLILSDSILWRLLGGGGVTFPRKEAAETANKVNKAVSKNLMKPTQTEMHIRSSECK